jgi:hypothetical protein
MIQHIGFESSPTRKKCWSSTTGSWGVDYGNIGRDLLQSNKQVEEDDEFDRWRLDEKDLEKWEHYELHSFGAWTALERWSEWFPEEFVPRANAVLIGAIGDSRKEWHLGGLLHALICCLLRFNPEEAWTYFVALNNGQMRLSVQSNFNVPEFFVFLWDQKKCSLAAHDDLRRTLLRTARNEFEIMVQSVAALAGGNENRLVQFAEEFLADELQRERALGVSVLAFVGTQTTSDRLTQISTRDAGKWVRHHAEWAKEVSIHEFSARSMFRRLMLEPDVYRLSAGLQVLKPALTPIARWWAPQIRNDLVNPPLSAKHAAILEAFWHHVEATRRSHVEIFGRKLDEFCRGERLDELRKAKLAPWWD